MAITWPFHCLFVGFKFGYVFYLAFKIFSEPQFEFAATRDYTAHADLDHFQPKRLVAGHPVCAQRRGSLLQQPNQNWDFAAHRRQACAMAPEVCVKEAVRETDFGGERGCNNPGVV